MAEITASRGYYPTILITNSYTTRFLPLPNNPPSTWSYPATSLLLSALAPTLSTNICGMILSCTKPLKSSVALLSLTLSRAHGSASSATLIPYMLTSPPRCSSSKRLSPALTLTERPSPQGGMNSTAHNCGNSCYSLRWMNYHPVLPVLPPPW